MCSVLQIINLHSHNSGVKKYFYLGPSIILFTEDSKMWLIQLHILEMFFTVQIKKWQGDVLEQDIELCPFCYFP